MSRHLPRKYAQRNDKPINAITQPPNSQSPPNSVTSHRPHKATKIVAHKRPVPKRRIHWASQSLKTIPTNSTTISHEVNQRNSESNDATPPTTARSAANPEQIPTSTLKESRRSTPRHNMQPESRNNTGGWGAAVVAKLTVLDRTKHPAINVTTNAASANRTRRRYA